MSTAVRPFGGVVAEIEAGGHSRHGECVTVLLMYSSSYRVVLLAFPASEGNALFV